MIETSIARNDFSKTASGARFRWLVLSQSMLFLVTRCLFAQDDSIAKSDAAQSPLATEFFEKKVRPILVKRCHECHSHEKAGESGNLAVDSRGALLKGGDRGPVVVAHKPESSLLIKAVGFGDPKLQMPPEGKLPAAEIEVLTKWIADGAFVPEYGEALKSARGGIDWKAAREFWSVRPLSKIPIPSGRPSFSDRERNAIDSFVQSKLVDHGLAPSPETDKRTLIRRVSFDLLGLPPTYEDVVEFVADDRPDAYERLVDRLLASPHFGERYCRHWLDMTRYVDETPDWQKNADGAWLYRDWVVRAINEDLPYHEFVRRQLAADQIDGASPRDVAALGFLGLSPTYWKELKLAPAVIEVIVADEWDERLDTVTRTFLGLTAACARCHDHKFDPITARDYYALAGVFASIDLVDRPLLAQEAADKVREARKKVATLGEALKKVKEKESDEAKKLQQQIDEVRSATPGIDAPMAPVVEEASIFVVPDGPDATKLDIRKSQPRDLPVFRRGNPSNPGDVTPRGFLELFARDGEIRRFQNGSGRLELADAILNDAASLAARVMINRIWGHHLGKGLVRTPGDFGKQGTPPSHVELLDWLSSELATGEAGGSTSESVHRRWRLKRIHRQIVSSAVYRQQSSPAKSDSVARANAIDPDNHLLWRGIRRQLELEPWRDAMLTVAGSLDDRMEGKALDFDQAGNLRRTLYGKIGRDEQHDLLRLFDFPPPTNHSPSRETTTTPLQQLFVLNSPFVDSRADEIMTAISAVSPEVQVPFLYRRLFQRDPTTTELRAATLFLREPTPARWRSYVKSLLGLNEFLFVD